MKRCDRCQHAPAELDYRYCADCRKDVLREMQESGYLTPRPYKTRYRDWDAQEAMLETKRGVDR